MTWRKRRRNWDDIFDDMFGEWPFGEEFDELMRRMMKDFNEVFQGFSSGEMKPFVKGFSVRIGPDGRPEIKEFGTKPFTAQREAGVDERRPLIDVMETENEVNVIAEMPGVEKEDIDVNASENSVEIKAESVNRKYYEKVDLPSEVNPDSAKARYNNGVLEIIFERKHPKKDDLKKVKIE